MPDDPVCTDPDKYTVIFENDRVRVLEYRDLPGGRTHPHQHPDSVMFTLSRFRRRLQAGQAGQARRAGREVAMEPGHAYWLPAQVHAGQNIGSTPTYVLFVELKEGKEGKEDRAADGAGHRAARPSVIGPS
jgi:beta-alanine degradation protein BauB